MIIADGSTGQKMVCQSTRAFRNSTPVLGANGNPAVGRRILCIGRSVFGWHEVKGETLTDASGNYLITVAGAGPNDRYILVGVGDSMADEYTRALGNMAGGVI